MTPAGLKRPLIINALEAILIHFGACIKADWKVFVLSKKNDHLAMVILFVIPAGFKPTTF